MTYLKQFTFTYDLYTYIVYIFKRMRISWSGPCRSQLYLGLLYGDIPRHVHDILYLEADHGAHPNVLVQSESRDHVHLKDVVGHDGVRVHDATHLVDYIDCVFDKALS